MAVRMIIHTGNVTTDASVVPATAVVANLVSARWNFASTAICVMQGSDAWIVSPWHTSGQITKRPRMTSVRSLSKRMLRTPIV